VSLLEVSVEAGDLGPVIVLAGDADGSSVPQLDEVLTAQVSARTRHLTIDATNLRSLDPATAQILTLAAIIVTVQGGSMVLVNPQEPVLKMLNHTRATDMFTIQRRTRPGSHRAPARPTIERRRPASMTEHEHEPDWSVMLRRQPASLSTGHPDDGTSMFEVICRECGDDPDLDYQEVSSELRRIRGPYPLAAGITAFLEHGEYHDRAEEGDGSGASCPLAESPTG
jgi:anti-anti-sigma factor